MAFFFLRLLGMIALLKTIKFELLNLYLKAIVRNNLKLFRAKFQFICVDFSELKSDFTIYQQVEQINNKSCSPASKSCFHKSWWWHDRQFVDFVVNSFVLYVKGLLDYAIKIAATWVACKKLHARIARPFTLRIQHQSNNFLNSVSNLWWCY